MLCNSRTFSPINSKLAPSFTLTSWPLWIYPFSRLKLCSNQAKVDVGGERSTESIWSADREKIVDWIIGQSLVTEVAWRLLGLCYSSFDSVYRIMAWLWSLLASLRSLCVCLRITWQLGWAGSDTEAVPTYLVLFFCLEGRLEECTRDDWLINRF